jgi:VanZ like family
VSRTRLVAAIVFVPALAAWTWKLLEPNPVPEPVLKFLSFWDFLPYLAAKTLHASGYAFLTALAWVAAPNSRWRWIAVGFLMLHGAGSELLQHVLPFNRTGKVTDVLIDWVGVTVGVLMARRFLDPMLGAVTQDELCRPNGATGNSQG